jgi:hypothetical protein
MTDLHPKFNKGDVVFVNPNSEQCVCTGAVTLSYEVMDIDGRKRWVSGPSLRLDGSSSSEFWSRAQQIKQRMDQLMQLALDAYSMSYCKTRHNTE